MHNYEKQFIELYKSGKLYFWNSNDSSYFYFLFHNTHILGNNLEIDRCQKFYKWDDYKQTGDQDDIMTDEDATYYSRLAHRELEFLSVMGMTAWLSESYTGPNYLSKVVATPEALSHVLVTKEETKGYEGSYQQLSLEDLKNFRKAYQQADLIERMKEARAKMTRTAAQLDQE